MPGRRSRAGRVGAAARASLDGAGSRVPVHVGATPRRWPWAVAAAVLGAAAGAGAVLAARRVVGEDAPGAQEPEQLRAVIDLTPEPGEASSPP